MVGNRLRDLGPGRALQFVSHDRAGGLIEVVERRWDCLELQLTAASDNHVGESQSDSLQGGAKGLCELQYGRAWDKRQGEEPACVVLALGPKRQEVGARLIVCYQAGDVCDHAGRSQALGWAAWLCPYRCPGGSVNQADLEALEP